MNHSHNHLKHLIALILCATVVTESWAATLDRPSIIPAPTNLEAGSGTFELNRETLIYTDVNACQTGEYLAGRLLKAAGYAIKTTSNTLEASTTGAIVLTTQKANAALGAEGYELIVTTNAVVIRAPTSAGLFYGVQTLLQLLPAEIYSAKKVSGVAWRIPCVSITDQPRFKWRGLMLDVSRHFFDKEQIKRLLDLMALHKLNTFHWHLVDHDGWRIAIKKYPQLTEIGGWRKEIGYGLDPRTSIAFGADGRYGGYYTQEEIREVVAYAQSRFIDVVPEIELPGHSRAALEACPEYNCVGPAEAKPNLQLGVYCAGNEKTFEFLQNVLGEVIELFPSRYVHIGGDEVSKENWSKCPRCRQRMTTEGLKDEHELQSYFVRRIGNFLNTHDRTLVGWSEIRQGGLAKNAVMMDWIGGGLESAAEGHDVVMSPGNYCYFDHYQSLDYSTEPVAIACYTPLRQVYEFEPIPAGLAAPNHKHILGAQANVWTEYIASESYLDYMTFPRLAALAEVVWSPRESRDWGSFSRRLSPHLLRLDRLQVKYRDNNAVMIGEWALTLSPTQQVTLEWDATELLIKPDPRHVIIDDITRPITAQLVTEPGKCHVIFDHASGPALKIDWVALLENGKEISRDSHPGHAGPEPRDLMTRNVVYVLNLSAGKKDARYTIQAGVSGETGGDLRGSVELNTTIRGRAR